MFLGFITSIPFYDFTFELIVPCAGSRAGATYSSIVSFFFYYNFSTISLWSGDSFMNLPIKSNSACIFSWSSPYCIINSIPCTIRSARTDIKVLSNCSSFSSIICFLIAILITETISSSSYLLPVLNLSYFFMNYYSSKGTLSSDLIGSALSTYTDYFDVF